MTEFMKIDGSEGEGGGQILRSSLTLSLWTGHPVLIKNIRARRSRPGLLRQHLTAVQAAAAIGQARVNGDELGSQTLEFLPGTVRGGQYDFKIGTAGSAMLVLQTILPVLIFAGQKSRITLSGGTHNPLAPPFDFFQRVFVPLINKMGANVLAEIHRYGFYPAGGGELEVTVEPTRTLEPIPLIERGNMIARRGEILLSELPYDIGLREEKTIRLFDGWSDAPVKIRKVSSPGPGNIIQIFLEYEKITESFNAFGTKGKRAEDLVRTIFSDLDAYLRTDVPVGTYLADQIMLPLAIAVKSGSGPAVFRTLPLSSHSRTHLDLIRRFLDVEINVYEEPNQCVRVQIGS